MTDARTPHAALLHLGVAPGVRVPGGAAAFRAWLSRLACAAAAEVGGAVSLDVLVTDDAGIREVNRRHLDHDWATDVLAFPGTERPWEGASLLLSAETARREAAARGHAAADELALYAVHAVLHLLGHDDHDPARRRRMRAAERRWLGALDRPAIFAGRKRPGPGLPRRGARR